MADLDRRGQEECLHAARKGRSSAGSFDSVASRFAPGHSAQDDKVERVPFRSACKCCSAFTLTSPRCRAAIPSAAARAAASVVIVDRKSTRLNSSHLVISYAV